MSQVQPIINDSAIRQVTDPFPPFLSLYRCRKKNGKESAVEMDEEKFKSVDSREHGNPFFTA